MAASRDAVTDFRALGVLDELERRRRREYDLARSALLRLLAAHDGSIPPPPLRRAHDGDVSTMTTPAAMTLQDVADALQVSLATSKRLVKAGQLRTVKVAGTTRVLRGDFEAYLASLHDEGEVSS